MNTIAILAVLLVIAVGGWIINWFKYRQLSAYLALKKVETPSFAEWELCAKMVWQDLTRREK